METRKQSLEQFRQNTNETLEKLIAMFHELVTDVQDIKEKDSINLLAAARNHNRWAEGRDTVGGETQKPRTMTDAMGLSGLVEEKLNLQRRA
ncbi:hypothetical protein ACSQ67_025313 [Phaseolus vulgaris]